MAAPARTKIDLSQLDSRPVLKLVPPLVEPPQPPQPPAAKPARGRHRPDSIRAQRVATCVPTVRRARFRLPVSFVIGVVVFLGVVGVGLLAGAMAGDPVPEKTAVVWVQPGDTLWDVAKRAAPGYDTEAVVARIRELNDVPANGILAGQALQVPSAP
jgi:nucleoid-associated protein YgaU